MKFTRDSTGRAHLAVVSSTSGRVIPLSTVDAPVAPTADVVWAAFALAAPELLRGLIRYEAGVSNRLAQTLIRETAGSNFMPGPVSDAAGQRLMTVGVTARLDWQGDQHGIGPSVANRRSITLTPVPLNNWTGRLFSVDRFVFAASVPASAELQRVEDLGHHLAAAVLVAERLRCDSIEVPRGRLEPSPAWEDRAIAVGDAIGLTLSFVNQATDAESDR